MTKKHASNAKRHLRQVHNIIDPSESDKLQKVQKPTEIQQLQDDIYVREQQVDPPCAQPSRSAVLDGFTAKEDSRRWWAMCPAAVPGS